MLQQLRTMMLPLAMLAGYLFSDLLSGFDILVPYLLFLMMFITFCRLSLSDIKLSGLVGLLLLFQITVSLAVYFSVRIWDETVAQGVMICIYAPTAVAATVVAGLMGARLETIAAFTLISNVFVALVSPVFFSLIGSGVSLPFGTSVISVGARVVPLIVAPILLSVFLWRTWPQAHRFVKNHQIYSFYLWSVAMVLVTARTVVLIETYSDTQLVTELVMAAACFVVCLLQFAAGRLMGRRYGESLAGGQALGQKNTVLAIWLSQTYLDPLSSVGPASYVLWQNIVNSWQIWRHNVRVRAEAK